MSVTRPQTSRWRATALTVAMSLVLGACASLAARADLALFGYIFAQQIADVGIVEVCV